MMFHIDLLKGQGIPEKSRPEGIATAVATAALPVVVAFVMLGFYLNNTIVISLRKSQIVNLEQKLKSQQLNEAVQSQNNLKSQKELLTGSISEVSSVIGKYTQWSGILETVVKNMPDSMALKSVAVKNETRKIKKAKEAKEDKENKENDSQKAVEVVVPVKTLRLSMFGSPEYSYDKEVKSFRDSLMADPNLRSKLDDIRVAQEVDKVEGKNSISYEIYLVFKPAL